MNRIRKNKAFTLAETLLAVAIVVILTGVVFVGVSSYLKSMHQLEMDGIAKEIYVSAQNHLSLAHSQGYLGLSGEAFGIQDPDDPDIYYFIGSYPGDDNSTVLDLMLPFASVDDTARLGGSYVIRYQKSSGLVLDVFYNTKDGTRFGYTFGSGDNDYSSLFPSYAGASNRDKRRDFNSAVIGYYGGDGISDLNSALKAPSIKVVNSDTLYVSVTDPNASADGIGLRLIIEGVTSEKIYTIDLKTASSVAGSNVTYSGGTYTVTLDDITNDFHFARLFGSEGFIPGEDIIVHAEAYEVGNSSNIKYSSYEQENSLFASLSNEDDGIITTTSANISNMRHLENLGYNVSGFSIGNAGITKAVQTEDLEWSSFIGSNYVTSAVGDAPTASGNFMPIEPSSALIYDGGLKSVSGVSISTSGADAGLFRYLTGGSVSNLKLTDFNVLAEGDGANAGALAGSVTNTVITGVIAYNSSSNDVGCIISAAGASSNAGGLIGTASGATINGCAAAVYVSSGGDAGGFIGTAAGCDISNSYSAGHTKDGVYSGSTATTDPGHVNVIAASAAGGFVGVSEGTTVTTCYSTCSVSGNTAGDFVGSSNGGTVSGSYCTGTVAGTAKGAFVGSNSGTSYTGDKYLSYLSYDSNGKEIAPGAAGITKIDEDLTAYNSFYDMSTAEDAVPYDQLLSVEYNGMYALKTISQLAGAEQPYDFLNTHYGDWPAAETLVINIAE